MDKELMDCLLSESERLAITEEDECYNFMEVSKFTAKAQLQSPKLKAYIEAQVQEAIQAERAKHSKLTPEGLPKDWQSRVMRGGK